MTMIKKIILLSFMLMTAITNPLADAQEHKIKDTLVIALRNDLPPLSFPNVEGQPAGLFVDMWKLWAEKTGQTISFRLATRKDTLELLENGTADIIGFFTSSDERSQWMSFSQPVYELGMCVFFPKNQEKIHNIRKLEGQKTGVTRGTAQEEALRKNYPEIEIVPFTGIEDMIHAVRKEKIRALVSNPASTFWILGKLGLASEFESTDETLFPRKLHAGVMKNNTELLALVDKGFDAMSDKEMAEIESRWIPDPTKHYYKTSDNIRLTAAEETWLKDHKNVRVGMSPVFPPLKFYEKGVIKGVEPDYLHLLAKLTGIHFQYVVCSFAEMDSKVKSGEIDMFISFHIPERLTYMMFTEPLKDYRQIIITRHDAPFMSGISALEGKKVAVVKGVKVYDKLRSLYPDIETVEVSNMEEMFKAVSESKADAMILQLLFAAYSMQNYPNLKIAGVADTPPDPYLYAVRKD
ncbi:MAG: hypothetical protein BWK80_22285, partial [Desulfobacteraceae bacterium IS3]